MRFGKLKNFMFFTEKEKLCEEHFVKNTIFNPSGRPQARLPFKSSITRLDSSFEIARQRFLYLEKQFSKDENSRKMYSDFIDEYIQLGYMSHVSFNSLNSSHFVIPHHPVLRT